MSEYFSETKSFETIVKIESDLSNYATKADLKDTAGVDASGFAEKGDLTNLKYNVDKLDIVKL